MGNTNLSAARKSRKDEFYTRLVDIENELKYYRDHFRDKTIFLNCDDPEKSNFWFFFSQNFNFFGLKRLISTHYTGLGSDNPRPSYMLELNRNEDGTEVDVNAPTRTDLEGDGDFRSEESVELLKQSDIVVTNPPFSLFREYISQLMEYGKKFIILGNTNAITYQDVWPYIQAGDLWLGASTFNVGLFFGVPEDFEYAPSYKFAREIDGEKVCRVSNICWYTNLDHSRRHEDIIVFRSYEEDPEKYPTYDNHDAINVDKVADIPRDFGGVMGVPITFVGKHNPSQFEILDYPDGKVGPGQWIPYVDGKAKYARILIRHKK